MNNFNISINAVLPIIAFISLGAIAKKLNYLDDKSASLLSKFSFALLIPINQFKVIVNSDFSTSQYYKPIAIYIFIYILICFLTCILVKYFVKENKKVASIAQALVRTNINLFGLTMMANLYGSDNIGSTALLVSCMVPVANTAAVIILKMNDGQKVEVSSLIKSVFANPLIQATLLGIICQVLNIHFNGIIAKTLNDVSNVASPIAFIALGASLTLTGILENYKPISIICFLKLIIMPLIVVVPAYLFGITGINLMNLFMLFGTPTAVSSYQMAKNMHADGELAGMLVFSTTLMSLFTTIVWIYSFSALGLLM